MQGNKTFKFCSEYYRIAAKTVKVHVHQTLYRNHALFGHYQKATIGVPRILGDDHYKWLTHVIAQ